jgi:hypothetical protein
MPAKQIGHSGALVATSFVAMELSRIPRVWTRQKSSNRGPIVRGIGRRPGNYALRDFIPPGARRFAANRRWPWRLLSAARYNRPAASPDPIVPNGREFDDHVLDYRNLENLRLVPGEIDADR